MEERIQRAWPHWVSLDALDGDEVGTQLHALVTGDGNHADRLLRAHRRLARLDAERVKLVQMAYADAIPMDLLKAEQHRISRERDEAEREIAEARNTGEGIMETYRRAQAIMQRGAGAYLFGGPDVRRLLTQAFLARIEVEVDDERATLASPWREIRDAANRARPLELQGQNRHFKINNNEPRPLQWPGFE